MEHCLAAEPDDEFRGAAGPSCSNAARPRTLLRRVLRGGVDPGFELTDDVNGYRQEGFAAFDGSTAGAGCRRRAPTCTR